MLLEAGADPTDDRDGYHDNEVLYHACEFPDPTCAMLVIDAGGGSRPGMDDITLALKVEAKIFRGTRGVKSSVDVNAVEGRRLSSRLYTPGEETRPQRFARPEPPSRSRQLTTRRGPRACRDDLSRRPTAGVEGAVEAGASARCARDSGAPSVPRYPCFVPTGGEFVPLGRLMAHIRRNCLVPGARNWHCIWPPPKV